MRSQSYHSSHCDFGRNANKQGGQILAICATVSQNEPESVDDAEMYWRCNQNAWGRCSIRSVTHRPEVPGTSLLDVSATCSRSLRDLNNSRLIFALSQHLLYLLHTPGRPLHNASVLLIPCPTFRSAEESRREFCPAAEEFSCPGSAKCRTEDKAICL